MSSRSSQNSSNNDNVDIENNDGQNSSYKALTGSPQMRYFNNKLKAIDELNKLYIQGYKLINSRLLEPGKENAKKSFEKSQTDKIRAADKKLTALLDASAESEEAQQLIHQISQNMKKLIMQKQGKDFDDPLILTFEANPHGQKYRNMFDDQGFEKFQTRYQNLLLYCKLAYLEEKNGIPEEHALKLTLLFDSDKGALEYLNTYINQKYNLSSAEKNECKTAREIQVKQEEKQRTLYTLHNACLWGAPNPKCNWDAWRKLAKGNMDNVNFRDTLNIAEDLEEIITKNQLPEPIFDGNSTKEQINERVNNLKYQITLEEQELKDNITNIKNTKRDKKIDSEEKQKIVKELEDKCKVNRKSLLDFRQRKYDFQPQYDIYLIKLKKEEIEKVNTKLKAKVKNQDTRGFSAEKKEALTSAIGVLADELSALKCKLFELSAGQPLDKLSVDELLAAVEFRNNQNFGELRSYLMKQGFTNKRITQFNELARKDDDSLIPNIRLEDREAHPGVYLMKVPVLDTMQAARAAAFGRLTNCCQSLGDVGADCAIHGLTSRNGGFYVVCKGDINNPVVQDEVLGQCWAWRSKGGAIVFDSIESNQNNNTAVKELFSTLALELIKDNHTDKVVCGARSGISGTMGITPKLYIAEMPIDYDQNKYRDSRYQRLIYDTSTPIYLFYHIFGFARVETNKLIQECLKQDSPLYKNLKFCSMLNYILIEQNNDLLKLIKKEAAESNKKAQPKGIWNKLTNYMMPKRNNKQLQLEDILNKLRSYMKGEVLIGDVLTNPENSFLLAMSDNQGRTLLHKAIIDNDVVNVENILRHEQSQLIINNKAKDGQSALHYAVKNDNQNAIRLLIGNGANINEKNKWGETPLHLAINKGYCNVVSVLFEMGGDIESRFDRTALMLAADKGHVDVAAKLIEKGVDIDEKNRDGETALVRAVISEHAAVVLKLIEKGANVVEKIQWSIPPLIWATLIMDIENGCGDIALKLIEKGTALELALKNLSVEQKIEAYNTLKDNVGSIPMLGRDIIKLVTTVFATVGFMPLIMSYNMSLAVFAAGLLGPLIPSLTLLTGLVIDIGAYHLHGYKVNQYNCLSSPLFFKSIASKEGPTDKTDAELKAYNIGKIAGKSWGGYFASYTKPEAYVHYNEYCAGQIGKQNRRKVKPGMLL